MGSWTGPGTAPASRSDWRRGRELAELRAELAEAVAPDAFAIVDDAFDMGPLAPRFVRTSPLTGLDQDAAAALSRLFEVASNDAAG